MKGTVDKQPALPKGACELSSTSYYAWHHAAGYSIVFLRRKLEKELRQAKAAELALATPQEQKLIEREIQAEVNREIKKYRAAIPCHDGVLWGH